ncbi:hypothetical protein Baya_5222 [Bagarius yarrelli]|uniref:Uncharacterized protein n=1 Tax=Bagarius yarrelli TaxID=175774 RepID=A0A556TU27_BAGYA|nr:hypothetical protein Baya_5222 [Bagarius yarrelli]
MFQGFEVIIQGFQVLERYRWTARDGGGARVRACLRHIYFIRSHEAFRVHSRADGARKDKERSRFFLFIHLERDDRVDRVPGISTLGQRPYVRSDTPWEAVKARESGDESRALLPPRVLLLLPLRAACRNNRGEHALSHRTLQLRTDARNG